MNSASIRLSSAALAVALAAPSLALAPQVATSSTGPNGQANAAPVLCGSPDFAAQRGSHLFLPPSDCGFNSNTAGAAYDPNYVMNIQVVWHVITLSGGGNDVTDAEIAQQMQMLNDDFNPPTGALGNDAGITFSMATVDPSGNPTNGINRVANTNWHNDSGNYASSLSWDSNRYLNIYTLSPFGGGGVIGYVPDLPQGGTLVGTTNDGVRMLHSAIASGNYNHVLSHEIGHHLGLFHTFSGCGNNCQTSGDLICDTNPHASPTNTCSGTPTDCGGQPEPRNNYMNYQDVSCVWEFSLGQIQRMRCTLENWRPLLFDQGVGIDFFCNPGNANSTGAAVSLSASLNSGSLHLDATGGVADEFGYFLVGSEAETLSPTVVSNGLLCLSSAAPNVIGRYNVSGSPLNSIGQFDLFGIFHNLVGTSSVGTGFDVPMDLPLPGSPTIMAGETWHFQLWYRDTPAGSGASNLSNGVSVSF